MSEAAEKLKALLLELPLDERMELADFLYESLPKSPGPKGEQGPGFDEAPDRRREEKLSGNAVGIPVEEFFRTLKKK